MRQAQSYAAASPIARREMSHALKRAAVFELGRATELAANLATAPAERLWLSKISHRLTARAASSRLRRLTPDGEPTKLAYSHLRACRKEVICMICARARSRRTIRAYADKLQALVAAEPNAPFAMATFTVPNVPIQSLLQQLVQLDSGYRKLLRLKRIANALLGSVASTEIAISYPPNGREPEAHAHIHALWCLRPDYFDRQQQHYISQQELTAAWSRSAGARGQQKYIVEIHRVRDHDGTTDHEAVLSVLPEIFKYQTKASSVVRLGEHGLYAEPVVVAAILKATHRRRSITASGIFLAQRKRRRVANQSA